MTSCLLSLLIPCRSCTLAIVDLSQFPLLGPGPGAPEALGQRGQLLLNVVVVLVPRMVVVPRVVLNVVLVLVPRVEVVVLRVVMEVVVPLRVVVVV